MKKTVILLIMTGFLATGLAWGEEKFEARLEESRVSVGNPIYLYVTFRGSQDVEHPETPSIDGLKIKFIGPSSEVSIVNGVVSRAITFTYLVIPLKSGEFKIGPFFAEFQGQTYGAKAVILVVNGTASSSAPSSSGPVFGGGEPRAAPPPYVDDKIFLTMDIDSRVVYINEIVPLTIKIYVDGLGLRDIEYPHYPHEGFSTGEFNKPERRTGRARGRSYDVLVFRQDLFGIKEGDYVLGPARLNCKMVVRSQPARRLRSSLFGITVGDDDFFSSRFGYKTYPIELESNGIPITILPFPEEGKPGDFQGAVGDFSMDVNVKTRKVKVGDPITLQMTVRGRGNLDTVTAPRLASVDDKKFKTYEPQVTKKEGRKIYEQIFIPKTSEVKEVPKVTFSFFNPRTKKYETLEKGPFPVDVVEQPESERSVKMVSLPGGPQMFYPQEKLGEDIIHIKEDMGELRPRGRFLYNNWLFWGGQIVPLMFFIAFYTNYRKRERILTDARYARFLRAPRKARGGLAKAKAFLGKNDVPAFYDAVFKTLQEYLAHRFNLPIGSVTSQIIEERLRPAGCDEEMLDGLRDIFSRCEMARYASSVPGGEEAEKMLEKVRRIIDHLEKVKI